MERTELIVKLTEIFKKQFSIDNLVLTEELTANDIEQWDSLSHMLLITEIENSISIKFKLKELNKMQNVGAMIDVIMSKF